MTEPDVDLIHTLAAIMKNILIEYTIKFASILIDATFIWAIFNYVIEYPIEWKVPFGILLILFTLKDHIRK